MGDIVKTGIDIEKLDTFATKEVAARVHSIRKGAPEEHDVYSLSPLTVKRSSGAQCAFGVFYMPLLTERETCGKLGAINMLLLWSNSFRLKKMRANLT